MYDRCDMFEREFEKLATTIRQAVLSAKEPNSLVTNHQIRVRRPDFNLRYRFDPQLSNFSPTRIEEDYWDWTDQERFQSDTIAHTQEFKSIAALLAGELELLEAFARVISVAAFHGLDDEKLAKYVDNIGRAIDHRPIPTTVIGFIDGISISESPLVISDNFVIRHPVPEDAAQYVVLDDFGGSSFPPSGHTWFSSIGEFIFEEVSTGLAQKEFLRLIDALRLYQVGGVTSNCYKMRSAHPPFFEGRVTHMGGGPVSRFNYTLSISDVPNLNKFLREIAPRLPDPFRPDKLMTEREIALTRYTDALFHQGPPEREITSAITALEALFLEGQTEITHRLAQRVSVFLRTLGTQADAQKTYEDVKGGYGIRSTFIHGGSLKSAQRPMAESLAPVLLEYARECVLVFFQLSIPKKEILKQLDRAMIDHGSVRDLEVSLAPAIHR
jgi:hypothetical protein